MHRTTRGRKPELAWLPVVAAAILATGCSLPSPDPADSSTPPDYGGVCVDPRTEQRVEDAQCGQPDDTGNATAPGGFFLLWMPTSSPHPAPAIGQRAPLHQGVRHLPAGTAKSVGVPRSGGAMSQIQRGGFGTPKAGSSSGRAGSSGGG